MNTTDISIIFLIPFKNKIIVSVSMLNKFQEKDILKKDFIYLFI